MLIKKRVLLILILIFVILLELFLRGFVGLTDAVLWNKDLDFEYIAQPNQDRYRFGNRILYNSNSMRSAEVDTTATIILGFGDSVINGGSLTDQDSLATTLLSDSLSDLYGKKVQFLNISAGSWGPDNAFAYLKTHGDFGTSRMYLVVSSHDAFDNMDFKSVVGVVPSYPDEQYGLAIFELVDRYIIPRIWKEETTATSKEFVKPFNSGFNDFDDFSQTRDIPFILVLHAELSELDDGKYNEEGQRIIEFADAHQIPIIKDLERGLNQDHYRDNIHLNEKGQKLLSKLIYQHEIANFN